MTDTNALELIKRGDGRFSRRQQLDSFRQEVALNFAPWLASWTTPLNLGDDFAAHLIDGTPMLMARDFMGQVGSMLRPPGKQWFWHRTAHDEINNNREAREYLDWRSGMMMRIMFDHVTGASRALKQSDEFFALFGDAVISVDTDDMAETLRIRSYHTKDVVWAVGPENKVDTITRREMMTARVIKKRFGEKGLSQKIKEACDKSPDDLFEVRHEVLPADEYDAYKPGSKGKSGQWASVWIDVDGKKVLRETTTKTMRYVVPRWVTMPDWSYAISPATTIALPDARLIQQQALAILEAAEKSVNPPLVAYTDALRGDVSLLSGGITWVDGGYDERTGAPVQPLNLGKNFNLGVDSLMRTEQQISRAFYLDVLRMPDTRSSKSTVEVQFRIDEYVRAALPLFAPIQAEYNDSLLYEVDAIIDLVGGYSAREKPQKLRRETLLFSWDNPLADMLERQKAQTVAEISQLGQTIAALEAAAQQAPALKQLDNGKMFRESVMGIGGSAWLLDEEEAEAMAESQNEANAAQQTMANAPNLAQLIDSGVGAAQAASTIPQQSEPGFAMLPAPA